MVGRWGGNRGPGGKQRQPTTGFMASVTCGLTAEDRDQLRNPNTLVSNTGLNGTSVYVEIRRKMGSSPVLPFKVHSHIAGPKNPFCVHEDELL